MRLFEITLKPLSALGTPLVGDTLFGQFCWQVAYDPELLAGGLEEQLAIYEDQPFAVFSSAYPRFSDNGRVTYALRRPCLPIPWLAPPPREASRLDRLMHLKNLKQKDWLLVSEDFTLNFRRLAADAELWELLVKQVPPEIGRLCRRYHYGNRKPVIAFPQPHNTINRQTLTTGEPPFAPYSLDVSFYLPESWLALFVLVNEAATDIDRICLGLSRIGRTGFGRDASLGLGRFEVLQHRELPLPSPAGADALYTLAPCVPAPGSFREAFFTPVVRFGKHGDRLARAGNPFKNPVVMAAEGAAFVPADPEALSRPYFGRAVSGVSKAQPNTRVQGYAPVLPLRLEVTHE